MALYFASNSDFFSGSYTDENGQNWSMSIDITFKEGSDDDIKKIEDGAKNGNPTGDNIMAFQNDNTRSYVSGYTKPAKTEFNKDKGIYVVTEGSKILGGIRL